ncbi:MAG: hypothetical protein J6X18_00755 [Bacteroidales bacterium]|nr:hypothetical protein [Bacteroidales bacterium]
MTNEEKALELVNESTLRDPLDGFGIALKMAAWKEQQMIDWLEKHAGTYQRFDVTENKFYYSYNLMIEDFKKAMKGE